MISQSGRGISWQLGLASSLAIAGVTASSTGNRTFAQITPDGTLGAESSVVTQIAPLIDQIDRGATIQEGTNLFHSFEQFSVLTGRTAYFNNAADIQNIITRVTGGSVSNIDGLLQANGTANLFLINPNGIIFGPNASLNIRGSFVASTASSLNFADGTQFSATNPQTPPLLTVTVPIGLQFGEIPGRILNQSQASPNRATNSIGKPVGLQVQKGRTLALVGGDLDLEGGNITAAGGRIELGSVAGNSLVRLNQIETRWTLTYQNVQNFQNIQIISRNVDGEISSFVDATGKLGESSGDIQVQGKHVMLINGSRILATNRGTQQGGDLTVTASESVELTGFRTELSTETTGDGGAGNLTINTDKLIVQGGAQILTSTSGKGSGGQLTVTASESVELIATSNDLTGLISATAADGAAGDITINTGKLIVQDGAIVSTGSEFGDTPATGRAGALTVNALDSVELIGTNSILSAITQGVASAGNITINTENLIVQDRAVIAVSSGGTGDTGNLEVTARSIRLENEGKLTATNELGRGGGNIRLQNLDSLLLRGNSEISTNADGEGNGGDITINTNTLTALENSDITANAIEGSGGNIRIRTQGLFLSPDSEITADSERGIDGVVEINTLNADPNQGLVNLPEEVVDAAGLVAQGCPANLDIAGRGGSKFTVTGRGGLPPTPQEALNSDAVLEDWGKIAPTSNEPTRENQSDRTNSTPETPATPEPFVPATGWVISSNGEVTLTAQAPTVTSQNPSPTPASCNGT